MTFTYLLYVWLDQVWEENSTKINLLEKKSPEEGEFNGRKASVHLCPLQVKNKSFNSDVL